MQICFLPQISFVIKLLPLKQNSITSNLGNQGTSIVRTLAWPKNVLHFTGSTVLLSNSCRGSCVVVHFCQESVGKELEELLEQQPQMDIQISSFQQIMFVFKQVCLFTLLFNNYQ